MDVDTCMSLWALKERPRSCNKCFNQLLSRWNTTESLPVRTGQCSDGFKHGTSRLQFCILFKSILSKPYTSPHFKLAPDFWYQAIFKIEA